MQLRALTEAEAMQRDHDNHPHWGGGLDLSAHVRREAGLRAGWWARQAREGWAWVEGDRILSTCETYRVPARRSGEAAVAWQIASVYTAPELRGQGHASAMLQALAASLAAAPGAAALTLYSDVAPAIYARLGFRPRPAVDRRLPADGAAALAPDLRYLAESELGPDLCPHPPVGALAIPVTAGILDWQIDHARWLAQLAGIRRAARCGACIGDQRVIWTEHGDDLLILHLHAPTRAADLLAAAARTAAELGLRHVRGWEVPGWPEGQGERVPRVGALPMIRPLRPDVDAQGWIDVPRALWV